jgi:hypothetical protein
VACVQPHALFMVGALRAVASRASQEKHSPPLILNPPPSLPANSHTHAALLSHIPHIPTCYPIQGSAYFLCIPVLCLFPNTPTTHLQQARSPLIHTSSMHPLKEFQPETCTNHYRQCFRGAGELSPYILYRHNSLQYTFSIIRYISTGDPRHIHSLCILYFGQK